MRLITTFGLLALLSLLPAHAAIFKWTDNNGNVQFGQFPPAGVKLELIKTKPAHQSTSPYKSPQERVEELNKLSEEKKIKKAKLAEEKQNEEIRKKNCENARYNIERLKLGGRYLTRMPDGSYQRLDDEQKKAAIEKNQKAIEENCK